jgi:ubiquinol-cytochrome c reductase cytochrome c1 subunit
MRMARTSLIAALAAGLALFGLSVPASARTTQAELRTPAGGFSFETPIFGRFDQGALQRGYKVYAEVCSSCHAMDLMYYRNLCQQNGPFYDPKHPNPNDAPVCKAIAASIKVPDIDKDTGDAIQRPATPADHFRDPFPNEFAARASNGGSLPPDLSVMARAREGGPAYIYSLLTGYVDPPAGLTVPAGKSYNPVYPGDLAASWKGAKDHVPPGGLISMPFQLTPNRVSFDDGTPGTTEQMAKDVATFLAWTAEPKQTERKEAGLAVMIYLLLLTGLVYLSYRRIWRHVAH